MLPILKKKHSFSFRLTVVPICSPASFSLLCLSLILLRSSCTLGLEIRRYWDSFDNDKFSSLVISAKISLQKNQNISISLYSNFSFLCLAITFNHFIRSCLKKKPSYNKYHFPCPSAYWSWCGCCFAEWGDIRVSLKLHWSNPTHDHHSQSQELWRTILLSYKSN